MADSMETKRCGNCKRDIAISNFLMHELHCAKNIAVCADCGEPVPRADLTSHFNEAHAPVICPLCQGSYARDQLENHKVELCPKRIISCSYCTLDIPFDECIAHNEYCGSRTEQCVKCGSYVMLREQIQHEEANCKSPPRKTVDRDRPHIGLIATGENFGTDMYRSMLDEFMWDAVSQRLPESGDDARLKSSVHGHRQASAQFRRPPFLLSNRSYQQEMESKYPSHRQRSNRQSVSGRRGDGDAKESHHIDIGANDFIDDASSLPCEFCNETYPADLLLHHQVICRARGDADDLATWKETDYGLVDDSWKTSSDYNNLQDHYGHDDVSMLPCEFCDHLFPTDLLVSHQSSCDVRHLFNHRPVNGHERPAASQASQVHADTLKPSRVIRHQAPPMSRKGPLAASTAYDITTVASSSRPPRGLLVSDGADRASGAGGRSRISHEDVERRDRGAAGRAAYDAKMRSAGSGEEPSRNSTASLRKSLNSDANVALSPKSAVMSSNNSHRSLPAAPSQKTVPSGATGFTTASARVNQTGAYKPSPHVSKNPSYNGTGVSPQLSNIPARRSSEMSSSSRVVPPPAAYRPRNGTLQSLGPIMHLNGPAARDPTVPMGNSATRQPLTRNEATYNSNSMKKDPHRRY